jgi:ketosteroid isomerase-like protein
MGRTAVKNFAIGLGSLLLGAFAAPGAASAQSYAEDRAQIENLSNRYMVAVDAGDIDTVMSTWADDGVLEWVGGVENGKEAIHAAMSNFGGNARAARIPEGATSWPRTRHQIINHVIDVEGDVAHTIAYWFATSNDNPEGEVRILYMGHYEDVLERRDGRWQFTKRSVYNESLSNRQLFYPALGESDPHAE